MIQDIYPHRFNNQFIPKKIENTDYILHYHNNTVLLKTNGETYELPRKNDIPEITDAFNSIYLFSFDEVACFLITDIVTPLTNNLIFKEISFYRTTNQLEIAWICMAGFQLMNWYMLNTFCGKCGLKTQHKPDERAIICTGCNTIVYPKISPAIIVSVICNNKILLIRGSNFPGSWYSLIAGYTDIGETLEETVIREVKEEVGLDVKNIRYYKSQPWPLSGSLMIGYIAEADDSQPICIDKTEIAEAAWFTRGNLPNHSLNLSIAGEMIEKFNKGELL